MISVRNLEKRYGRSRVLAGIDFELPHDGFLLVTGANGSGKTTLLRVLTGLVAPTRGSVVVEVEVLERRQLPVYERLVREKAEAPAVDLDLDGSPRRGNETGEDAQKCRFPRAVCPRDEKKSLVWDLEVDSLENAAWAIALLEVANLDHGTSTAAATKAKKTMLITPFTVKNAASSRPRFPGLTIRCS